MIYCLLDGIATLTKLKNVLWEIPTLILFGNSMKVLSPLWRITLVSSPFLKIDHKLKTLPNGAEGGTNTYCDFTSGSCNKLFTTKTVFLANISSKWQPEISQRRWWI